MLDWLSVVFVFLFTGVFVVLQYKLDCVSTTIVAAFCSVVLWFMYVHKAIKPHLKNYRVKTILR
jgi:hypothetical protein